MTRAHHSICLLGVLASGCGYGFAGRTGPTSARVHVQSVVSAGAEPEVPALVEAEVRRAVMSSQHLRLVDADPDISLAIRVLPVQLGLEAFSEPGLRAAQYRATVRLDVQGQGPTPWRPVVFSGVERFFSPPGRIERLDGDGRRALSAAARRASARLVRALELRASTTSTLAQPNRTQ